MDLVQFEIFTFIVREVETPLIGAVTLVTNAFLGFVANPLKVSLVLYIALTGALYIMGSLQEDARSLLPKLVKMSLVVWLITGAGNYQQYVYDLFFTTLPASLAGALTASGASGTVNSSSFDQVWLKSFRAGLEVWRTLSWSDVANKMLVVAFWLVAALSTVVTFAIWLSSRVVLALYVALGPLLVPLVLFNPTRAIFERWVGSLIACVLLQVTTIVLLYIVLAVETVVIGTIAKMDPGDFAPMIGVLLSGIIFFLIAAFVASQLPALAGSLSGGLVFHTGTLARMAQGAVGAVGKQRTDSQGNRHREPGRGALGAGQAGLGLAARGLGLAGTATRVAYQRLRPSPGGSLSDRTP